MATVVADWRPTEERCTARALIRGKWCTRGKRHSIKRQLARAGPLQPLSHRPIRRGAILPGVGRWRNGTVCGNRSAFRTPPRRGAEVVTAGGAVADAGSAAVADRDDQPQGGEDGGGEGQVGGGDEGH